MPDRATTTSDLVSEAWIPATEYGPVSAGTHLVGDRWSLLIVREMLVGTVHFNELYRALPGLSRSLLASRLRYLQHIGIVTASVDPQGARNRSAPYALTASGQALEPVLAALGAWTIAWRMSSEEDDTANAALLLWRMQQSIDRSTLPNGRVVIQFVFESSDTACGWLRVGAESTSTCVGTTEREVDLTVRTTTEVMSDLWWGRRACERTIADRKIIFDGPADYARQFSTWFGKRQAVQQTLAMS